jgi:hypothetical protein
MIYSEEQLLAAGYRNVRIEPNQSVFRNIETGELFEPTQTESFTDQSGKEFIFFARPGDDLGSRHSTESLESSHTIVRPHFKLR